MIKEYYLVFFIIGSLFMLFESIVPDIGILGLIGLISFIIGIIAVSPSLPIAIILIILFLIIVTAIVTVFFKNLPKPLILKKVFSKEEGFSTSKDNNKYIGEKMITKTPLKPSGKVSFNEKVFDATTEGDFVEKGKDVIVIDNKGYILVVKSMEEI